MRISDWSSDVCSSDLLTTTAWAMDGVQHNPSSGRSAILPGRSGRLPALGGTDADAEIFDLVVVTEQRPKIEFGAGAGGDVVRTRGPSRLRMDDFDAIVFGVDLEFGCCDFGSVVYQQIGSASCRESVCSSV